MQSDGETDIQEYGKYKTSKRKEYLNDFSALNPHERLHKWENQDQNNNNWLLLQERLYKGMIMCNTHHINVPTSNKVKTQLFIKVQRTGTNIPLCLSDTLQGFYFEGGCIISTSVITNSVFFLVLRVEFIFPHLHLQEKKQQLCNKSTTFK